MFSKSNWKFRAKEILKATSVATDRSINEKAVHVCKQAWYLLKHNRSNNNKDNQWLCDI